MAEPVYKKITQLDTLSASLDGNETLPIVKSGKTYRRTWANFFGSGWITSLLGAFSAFKSPDANHADDADTVGGESTAQLHAAGSLTGALNLAVIPAELTGKNAATATLAATATTSAACSGNAATATLAATATTSAACSGNAATATLAATASACSGNAATSTNSTNSDNSTAWNGLLIKIVTNTVTLTTGSGNCYVMHGLSSASKIVGVFGKIIAPDGTTGGLPNPLPNTSMSSEMQIDAIRILFAIHNASSHFSDGVCTVSCLIVYQP